MSYLSRTLLAEERISMVEAFFSAEECKGLIGRATQVGWTQSPPSGGGHGRTGREDPRTSKFSVFNDEALARTWWRRLQPLLPENLAWLEKSAYYGDAGGVEWTPVGIVERLRFYKYEKGDEYPDHYDGSYRRTVKRWKDAKEEELETFQQQTFLTLLVYLNDGMKGGETVYFYDKQHCRFLRDALEKKVEIHASLPIISGEKYVLRTDIIFERKLKGHARLQPTGTDAQPSVSEWEKLYEPSCKDYHN